MIDDYLGGPEPPSRDPRPLPGETCEQRNMRVGWGCKCHGMTFCPNLRFVGYEDDVPIFERIG